MANVKQLATAALAEGAGILRLAPNWVPRSFLQPGRRIKLHPADYYALGTHRGGIDERWFASTTPATNEGAPPDEGLSYVRHRQRRFTLRDAVAELGAELVGEPIWNEVPALAGLFEVFRQHGADPPSHASERRAGEARRAGRKARVVLLSAAAQRDRQQFPVHVLRPGAGDDQSRTSSRCLEHWNEGDNGILDLSKAYRLKPGTGWLVPPCVLHAPGSLVHVRAAMGQRRLRHVSVDGRGAGRAAVAVDEGLSQGKARRRRITWSTQLDWEGNVESEFQGYRIISSRFPSPTPRKRGTSTAGSFTASSPASKLFTAKELTVDPGAKCTIKDGGAYGWITVQGEGRIGKLRLQTPAMIRFGQMTEDEVFVSAKAAKEGVVDREHGFGTARRPALLRSRRPAERLRTSAITNVGNVEFSHRRAHSSRRPAISTMASLWFFAPDAACPLNGPLL